MSFQPNPIKSSTTPLTSRRTINLDAGPFNKMSPKSPGSKDKSMPTIAEKLVRQKTVVNRSESVNK